MGQETLLQPGGVTDHCGLTKDDVGGVNCGEAILQC